MVTHLMTPFLITIWANTKFAENIESTLMQCSKCDIFMRTFENLSFFSEKEPLKI